MDNGKHSGNSKATNRGDPGPDMTSLIVVISFYCYKICPGCPVCLIVPCLTIYLCKFPLVIRHDPVLGWFCPKSECEEGDLDTWHMLIITRGFRV